MSTGEVPERVRAFVAIYPTPEVLAQLEAAQNQMRASVRADVRWAKPEQIHLTLQFLGYVGRGMIHQFEAALAGATRETRRFALQAVSMGCFPNCKRPKIIWAGLAGELDPLFAMKEKLDVAFDELGWVPEARKFHAHLTLGRAGHLTSAESRRLAQEISRFQSKHFGQWKVREIHLMQSDLSSTGATHRVLNLFPLEKV